MAVNWTAGAGMAPAACAPCYENAVCEPSCSIECHRTGLGYGCDTIPDGPCSSAAIDDNICQAIYEASGDRGSCPLPCPPSAHVISLNVRAACSCLSVGIGYKVSIMFEDAESNIAYTNILFTATASEETTSWASSPTPNAIHTEWSQIGACAITVT